MQINFPATCLLAIIPRLRLRKIFRLQRTFSACYRTMAWVALTKLTVGGTGQATRRPRAPSKRVGGPARADTRPRIGIGEKAKCCVEPSRPAKALRALKRFADTANAYRRLHWSIVDQFVREFDRLPQNEILRSDRSILLLASSIRIGCEQGV
jgi:hypothetical protein